MTVSIYQTPDYEIHMIGKLVGIAFPTEVRQVSITGPDGRQYSRPETVRKTGRFDRAFIGFFTIRKDAVSGEYFRDDDNPIADGVNSDIARLLARELVEAAAYFEETGAGQ
jgi:hypothetical protein